MSQRTTTEQLSFWAPGLIKVAFAAFAADCSAFGTHGRAAGAFGRDGRAGNQMPIVAPQLPISRSPQLPSRIHEPMSQSPANIRGVLKSGVTFA